MKRLKNKYQDIIPFSIHFFKKLFYFNKNRWMYLHAFNSSIFVNPYFLQSIKPKDNLIYKKKYTAIFQELFHS